MTDRFPRVITLCGSTRFKRAFAEWNARLTLEGAVVFSIAMWGMDKRCDPDPETKARLDAVHLAKIERSDEIFVLDLPFEGVPYIGESTAREIAHAQALGKPVRYLSELCPGWTEDDCAFLPPRAESLPLLPLPRAFPAAEIPLLMAVVGERMKQISERGWTPEHDDRHGGGELAMAGAAYLAVSYLGAAAATLFPWIDSVRRWMARTGGAPGDSVSLEATAKYLVRKPRLDRLVTGVTLGFAEAARELRAGETLP